MELIADLLDAYGEARPTEGQTPTRRACHGGSRDSAASNGRPGDFPALSRLFLTEAGRKIADRARHRFVVKLLLAVGVPTEAVEADAEGM